MIALAVKHDYKIVSTEEGCYGDKVKIRLTKILRHKREIRILFFLVFLELHLLY